MPDRSRQYGGRLVGDRDDERRRRFLDSALTVFYERGYSSSTVLEICRHAALSTRQFYDSFADKESVLAALYDETNTKAQTAVLSSFAAGSQSFAERFRAAVRAYAEVLTSDRRMTHLVVTSIVGVSEEFEAKRDVQRQQWIGALNIIAQGAIDNGELPRRDFTLAWTALIGAINAIAAASMKTDPPSHSLDEMFVYIDAVLWTGLLSE